MALTLTNPISKTIDKIQVSSINIDFRSKKAYISYFTLFSDNSVDSYHEIEILPLEFDLFYKNYNSHEFLYQTIQIKTVGLAGTYDSTGEIDEENKD